MNPHPQSDKLTSDEAYPLIGDTSAQVSQLLEQLSRLCETPEGKSTYLESLYQPDEVLKRRIEDYVAWKDNRLDPVKGVKEDAGKLMEEIAFLAFRCLAGKHGIFKSGQSEAAQLDLIVTVNDDPRWDAVLDLFHIERRHSVIVIECKNTDEGITDSVFSRLCYIIHTKYSEMCSLGIFFSREGLTGAPRVGDTSSQRALRDARASQALFHAFSRKFVVVLDDHHIMQLSEKGALPRILEGLIREVANRFGDILQFDENWRELSNLPPHLAQYEDVSD